MTTDNLMERGYFAQSLGEIVSYGEMALRHTPALVSRLLDDEMWKERVVPQTREVAKFATFQRFVEGTPPNGLGTTLAVILKLCADHPDVIDKIAKVTP